MRRSNQLRAVLGALITLGLISGASATTYNVLDSYSASAQDFDSDWELTNTTYKTTSDGYDVISTDCTGTGPDCNFASTKEWNADTIDAVRAEVRTDGTMTIRAVAYDGDTMLDSVDYDITSNTTVTWDNFHNSNATDYRFKLVTSSFGGSYTDGFVSFETLDYVPTELNSISFNNMDYDGKVVNPGDHVGIDYTWSGPDVTDVKLHLDLVNGTKTVSKSASGSGSASHVHQVIPEDDMVKNYTLELIESDGSSSNFTGSVDSLFYQIWEDINAEPLNNTETFEAWTESSSGVVIENDSIRFEEDSATLETIKFEAERVGGLSIDVDDNTSQTLEVKIEGYDEFGTKQEETTKTLSDGVNMVFGDLHLIGDPSFDKYESYRLSFATTGTDENNTIEINKLNLVGYMGADDPIKGGAVTGSFFEAVPGLNIVSDVVGNMLGAIQGFVIQVIPFL